MANDDLSWDSDSTSEGGVSIDGDDPVLYEHLHTLRDGVTRGPITDATTLVPLYDFQADTVDNVLLENLTGICRSSIQCQLVLEDGTLFPPTECLVKHQFHMRLTYNKLLFAPVIRLVCNFVVSHENNSDKLVLLPVVLEWHFNDYDGPDTGIRDYTHSPDGIISFSAGPATSEGLNVPEGDTDYGEATWPVLSRLRTFISKGDRQQLKFKLKMSSITKSMATEFGKIFDRLPSGDGNLLPSIGQTEYSAWGKHPDHVHSKRDGMLRPAELLRDSAKHPMVILECGDTFATVKEAGVQLAYAATTAHYEAVEAVRLWASVPHRGRLFCVGSFVVIGVNFNVFPRLGSVKDEISYRLPNQVEAKLTFRKPELLLEQKLGELQILECGGYAGGRRASPEWEVVEASSPSSAESSASHNSWDCVEVFGNLVENVSGLPPHDAFFQLSPKDVSDLGGVQALRQVATYFELKIDPSLNTATYAAQLETIAELQRPKNARWHAVLLNQVHDVLNNVDLTQAQDPGGVIPPHVRAHADRWLLKFMRWNAEQLAVIRGIKCAKGGVIIVMGPAGTGKTLLQQALAVYFYMLGFHVLALAPANSNADHLATELKKLADRDMHKVNPQTRMGTELHFNRLWPSSRDQHKASDTVDSDNEESQVFLGSLRELMNGLQEYQSQKGTVREHGVVHAVIKTATEAKLVLSNRLRNDNGVPFGEVVNAWHLLRKFMRKYRNDDPTVRSALLAQSNNKALEIYRQAYNACKGHIIGLNRFMITTTTTARSRDMVRDWYEPKSTYGCPRVGVIVFVDEAAKDLESQCWAGVVCDKWATAVTGVVMFGDDKQLRPTNLCSRGAVTFNAFNDRLNIDLPSRLVREGFPVYRLLEQRRMHQAISAFPNREIYRNKLRDGPGTDADLDERFPGLKRVLIDIQADYGIQDRSTRNAYKYVANDAMARLHWIEVHGKRVRNPASQSICVHEHVDVFFTKIFPSLLSYFQQVDKNLSDNVMVICAYGYALHEYQERVRKLMREEGLRPSDMPKIMTVDGSQGNEAPIVFFDGSLQYGDASKMGFMSDAGRVNVAITRAKDVFWIIGGSMSLHSHRRKKITNTKSLPLMTKYKQKLDASSHVHRLG